MTTQTPIILALVILVLGLTALGLKLQSPAVLTMAASALTGLFAFLQVHPPNPPAPPAPETKK